MKHSAWQFVLTLTFSLVFAAVYGAPARGCFGDA
jgi:hypothetical protein